MYQIIRPASDSTDIAAVQYLNGIRYDTEELKLFTESVCEKIGLNSLYHNIKGFRYNHDLTQELIYNISRGSLGSGYATVSDGSKRFHQDLFDVLYLKTLEELSLMVNGDPDIVPVVKWRFQVGK